MAENTEDFSELAVPGEPGVYWCWRHRKVQTRLRCGRCEKPICPKCTRMGPTGARCQECISNRTQHIYQVSPLRLVGTFVASALLSAFCATLVSNLGIFLLLFMPLAAGALSKLVTVITGGKRGSVLATVAITGVVAGALYAVVGDWMVFSAVSKAAILEPETQGMALQAFVQKIGSVIVYLLIVSSALWYWIR